MAYLSKAEWERVAEEALGQAVEVVHFALTPLNAMGGFMGDHQLATVKVRDATQSEAVLKFFLKAFPKGLDSQMKLLQQTNGFTKEVVILSSFFPEVKASLRDGGAAMEWTCRCLFTRPDVIVLEDLFARGFRTLDNRGPITFPHIQQVLTNLANMHAASIVFEESRTHQQHQQQPFRLDAAFPQLMKETFFRHGHDHPGTPFMKSSIELLFALVERIHGLDALAAMKKDLRVAMELTYELNKPSGKFRNVMCHGDVKRDNIFFRYEDDVPVEARLVDFQVLRYTPPANDVISFLYLSTDRKFREEYFQQSLRHYHERLGLNLKRHGLDVERVLSWESFRESCDVFRVLGVTIAVCYAPFLFFQPQHIEHVFSSSEGFEHFFLHDRISETLHAFRSDDFFRRMVEDIVDELIEECAINKIHLRHLTAIHQQ